MTNVIGWPGRPLPQGQAINLNQNPSYPAIVTQKFGVMPVTLQASQVFVIPPGNWMVTRGRYTFLQYYDSNGQFWRNYKSNWDAVNLNSDGSNFRLANCTGCPVGMAITNHGTGYTAAPTAVPNLGGSTWRCILGASISSTVTVTAAGTGYTLPPILVIDPPPPGGIQATATVPLSGSGLGTVVVTNQGAGYTSVPAITVVNAAGDTTGTGGRLTAALIAAATAGGPDTVAAIVPVTYGTPRTAVTTFTFTGGGGGSGLAATAIMCFTALTITSTGQTHAANGGAALIGSTYTAGDIVPTNPAIAHDVFTPELGYSEFIASIVTGTVASPTIVYGGLHQTLPQVVSIFNSDGTVSGSTTWANTVGGITDHSYLQMLD